MNEENPMVMGGDAISAARSAELDELEMVVCKICEQEVPDEECRWGVCDSCLAKASTFQNAVAYGADRKVQMNINGFFAYSFTESEIEEILENCLKLGLELLPQYKRFSPSFLTDDSSDFAEWLIEREKGEK